jgi:hypothetical protein
MHKIIIASEVVEGKLMTSKARIMSSTVRLEEYANLDSVMDIPCLRCTEKEKYYRGYFISPEDCKDLTDWLLDACTARTHVRKH